MCCFQKETGPPLGRPMFFISCKTMFNALKTAACLTYFQTKINPILILQSINVILLKYNLQKHILSKTVLTGRFK